MWQLSLSTVVQLQRQHSPATTCLLSQKQPPPTMMPTMITSCMRLGSSGDGCSPRVWSPCCRQPPAKARAVCPPACCKFLIHRPPGSQCIPREASPIPGVANLDCTQVDCVGPAVSPTPKILVISVPGMEFCSPAPLTLGLGITRMAAIIRLGTQQLAAALCTLICPAAQIAVGMMTYARQVVRCYPWARTCMKIMHQPWWQIKSGKRARQWTFLSGGKFKLCAARCLVVDIQVISMLKLKLHCTHVARLGFL